LHGRGTIAFTGKVLCRVEIPNYQPGTLKRHGCPSHGIALTPDEKELWVVDGATPPRCRRGMRLVSSSAISPAGSVSVIEIVFDRGKAIRAGNQFGVGAQQ
jgi:hypothetical protein